MNKTMEKQREFLRPILNRDFQHPPDGWYHLEAKGEHPNKRAGVIQIIDDAACESIVNRFNAEAERPGFPGMLIDHEHFKHDEDKETRGYGWLMRLQNRTDGFYGQIRWTGTGQKAVDDGDYRFFSTEYDPADLQVLPAAQGPGATRSEKKSKRVRPMRLDGLTLTNVNNNKGQKPITNREEENSGRAELGCGNRGETQETMQTLRTELNLADEANEADILREIRSLKRQKTEVEESCAEAVLNAFRKRFHPRYRPLLRSMLLTNRDEAIEYLESIDSRGPQAPFPLHNRAVAQPVDEDAGGAHAESLRQAANEEILRYRETHRSASYEEARNHVRNRKPELFGLAARD